MTNPCNAINKEWKDGNISRDGLLNYTEDRHWLTNLIAFSETAELIANSNRENITASAEYLT